MQANILPPIFQASWPPPQGSDTSAPGKVLAQPTLRDFFGRFLCAFWWGAVSPPHPVQIDPISRPVAISHTAPTSFMRPSAIRARPSDVFELKRGYGQRRRGLERGGDRATNDCAAGLSKNLVTRICS